MLLAEIKIFLRSHLNVKDRAEGRGRAGGEREGAQSGDVGRLRVGREVEMVVAVLRSVGGQTGRQRETTCQDWP